MPIKVFCASGDHKDDFDHVETQGNEWIASDGPDIRQINSCVNQLPVKRDHGQFMLTLVIHYEKSVG